MRNRVHHWRTRLAAVAGIAVAVAFLAGALIVGHSVRASLRNLFLQRLGRTEIAVLSPGFFRAQLADAFPDAVPLVVLEGVAVDQKSGRRALHVQVYGVDDRFWRFHRLGPLPLGPDEALINDALATDLATRAGTSLVLRVGAASSIPVESLHGRKGEAGRSIPLVVRDILPSDSLGDFSLSPRQGSVRIVFMPLARVQQWLDQPGRVNAVLVAGGDRRTVEQTVRERVTLDDYGLRVRTLDALRVLALESRSTMLSDTVGTAAMTAAERIGLAAIPTLTSVANTIRAGDREIPYSIVSAIDLPGMSLFAANAKPPGPEAIFLNAWAAKDLNAKIGDPISLDYDVWEAEGRLRSRTADFKVAGIVPIGGAAADRDLVPGYPGIVNAARLADWDLPFPVDPRRIRPQDEEYWRTYRTTPKAFISIERGQALWSSRYGGLTALRIVPTETTLEQAKQQFSAELLTELDPLELGFSVYDVRAQGLAASAGAADFGKSFMYFGVVPSFVALLLALLFVKLGVPQTVEAVLVAVIGGVLGAAGAVGYAALVMYGLRTWWVDAVGTRALRVEVDALSLSAGAIAVVVIAIAAIWWSRRSLRAAALRSVLFITLIAFAAFIIIFSIIAKRDEAAARLDPARLDPHSGGGGYPLLVETVLPIVHDVTIDGVHVDRFRLKTGDDTSRLNLYQPRNPRVLGATPGFIAQGRFTFQDSLAETPQERANPWLLLYREYSDGAIPVIADAESIANVLHKKLGEDLVLPGTVDRPVKLRLVAALEKSLFQSELVMAEGLFLRTFPASDGYRFFLVETAATRVEELTRLLESRWADVGADVTTTHERLAAFRRVASACVSIFQMLGGVGIVIGALGLGVLTQRRSPNCTE